MNILKAFLTKSQGKKTVYDTYGDVNARWYALKDNEAYAEVFQEVPELNAIVTNKSKQIAKGIWMCRDTRTGDPIENDKFLEILKKPNPLMSGSEFLQAMYVDKEIFGNAYNFLLAPANQSPTPENTAALYNLSARYTYPNPTGKLFYQTKLEDIITKYVFHVRGQEYDFRPNQICHISNTNVNFLNGQYVVGESPLKSLNWALSNIKAAYEARNIYITRRGAFGVLSNNSKSDMGIEPIDDKAGLQNQLNKYGLSKKQWQFIVTNADVKWNPISIPTKDLELYKEVREDVIAIANQYNFPVLLLNYMEGSTFSNMETAARQLYTDAIIPDAKHIAQEINRTVNAYDFNKEYYLSYDHVEALQTDKKVEAERNEINIRSIISLNEAIQAGSMTLEAALSILINVVGMNEDEAEQILSPYNEKNQTEQGANSQA